MKASIFTAVSLVLVSVVVRAADLPVSDASPAIEHSAPDNTKINKRDKNAQTLTPMDQSNAKSDIRLSRSIRKSIMKQHLSLDAKNIKIISQNGNVTLRGPVRNDAEKTKIEEIANAAPGIKTLHNQLEVK
jgi:hyperosmotically inducible protein